MIEKSSRTYHSGLVLVDVFYKKLTRIPCGNENSVAYQLSMYNVSENVRDDGQRWIKQQTRATQETVDQDCQSGKSK